MKNKGITLISLIITIVLLIILASISISLSIRENGLFNKAKYASEETNKQAATEIINLKITTVQMNKYAEKQEIPTLQEIADEFYEDSEIQYVALESKVDSNEKVIVGNNTSIYTKLNKYPYEFEINSSLQLASIDGIKIANNYKKPEGIKEITENGTYDIANYATAHVNVNKPTYIGCFSTPTFYVKNDSYANITINNLTIGKKHFLIIGRALTGGTNAELSDHGTSFTNATSQKISTFLYSFVPTSTSIIVSQSNVNWGATYGSQTRVWVFEGELN